MIKAYKIRLKPTKEQEILFKKSAGIARFIYNYCLDIQSKNYKDGNKFINQFDMRKYITTIRNSDEYYWLKEVSNDIPKQAVKDLDKSFKIFFNNKSSYPNFKKKNRTKSSFYNDNIKLKIDTNRVYLSKIGWVKTSEQLPRNHKYSNPRVTYDNKYWYISVSVDTKPKTIKLIDKTLGIDLGLKDLVITSDGKFYANINKSKIVRKLEKRRKRQQRSISRKYEMNRDKEKTNKRGTKYVKTKNIEKLEQKQRVLYRKLRCIRDNYIHQLTTKIVKTKPSIIVVEDLNISGMVKNKHIAKAISESKWYEIDRQLEYKCKRDGIKLIKANRFYPSSKICSNCGYIKQDLKLKDRIYCCPNCGNKIDRDLNASINLSKLPSVLWEVKPVESYINPSSQIDERELYESGSKNREILQVKVCS